MKRKDVQRLIETAAAGGTQVFAAKVSGRVVPVRVLRESDRTARDGRRKVGFHAQNLVTNRQVELSAARLRSPLWARPDGGWTTAAPQVAVAAEEQRDPASPARWSHRQGATQEGNGP